MNSPIVLASTSRYRRSLLARLGLPFDICAPQVDEARREGESPAELVLRLAEAKARAGASHYPQSLIIGSDQVAVAKGEILGKPLTVARCEEQLRKMAGTEVQFLTGLCLFDARRGLAQVDLVPFRVSLRPLSDAQIENYVRRERPLDCAGGFKAEGLGISLFSRLSGEDPNALIGLPLIRLVGMLEQAGIDVLASENGRGSTRQTEGQLA